MGKAEADLGAWAWYEAMDRATVAEAIITSILLEHPAISKTPKARHFAETAVEALSHLANFSAEQMTASEA